MSNPVLAIVQARSSSSRLPRKVLADLEGMPMIVRQLERISRSSRIDHIVVATSEDPSDDELATILDHNDIAVRRGSLDDVLQRFIGVVDEFEPAHVVRLTADCPLTDPKIIDDLIDLHTLAGTDYSSNVLKRSFPHGLDAECVRADALRRVNALQLTRDEREHVTMGIYRRPSEFSLSSLEQEPSYAHLRWTVDYQSDLDFVRAVYGDLYRATPAFDQRQILDYLNDHPQLVYTDPKL